MLLGMSSIWLKPLWGVGAGVAVGFAVLWILGFLLRQAAPTVAAIARTTAKESVSQPLFYVLLAVGAFGLFLFPFIPYYTLGEDVKMVKDTGLTLVMAVSIFWPCGWPACRLPTRSKAARR